MINFNGDKEPFTVVVAEDSPMQALNLKELLTQVGLRVFWAENGVECIKLVEQTQPGLVLLDLEMPEMNGLQACQILKERHDTSDIPIILFTRHDDPEFARLGFQSGVVDFIPKDAFAFAVLLETLVQLGIISAETRESVKNNNGE